MKSVEDAMHLCMNMQRIFAKGGVWETPWMERVLPTIEDISERYAARTVFTPFVTPVSPDQAQGQWRLYFKRWEIATRGSLGGSQLDLVPELARFVPPATVVDKSAYSAFFGSSLSNFLLEKRVRIVVVSGAETDVCVLSTDGACAREANRNRDCRRTFSAQGGRCSDDRAIAAADSELDRDRLGLS